MNEQPLLDCKDDKPQFFFDENGCVGVAPSNTQISDTICRFHKSDIVAILRLQNNGQYCFVGRAIVFNRQSYFRDGNSLFFKGFGRDDLPRFEPDGPIITRQNSPPPHERGSSNPISLWVNPYTIQLLTRWSYHWCIWWSATSVRCSDCGGSGISFTESPPQRTSCYRSRSTGYWVRTRMHESLILLNWTKPSTQANMRLRTS